MNTIREIVKDLVENKLDAQDQEYFGNMTLNQLRSTHRDLGMFIRNHYGLWVDSPLTKSWRENESTRDIREGIDYSSDHPDAVSEQIIVDLHKFLQSYLN